MHRISTLITLPLILLYLQAHAQGDRHMAPGTQEKQFSNALNLAPDIENGRKIYRYCVTCHGPEGWGSENGAYPQIAGQLKNVIVKQLDDIRRGNRDNPIMRAFTSPRILPGAQEIADVAGYIAGLPMTRNNGKPAFADIENGAKIYERDCANCHGDKGQGDPAEIVPLIQGQHFNYLMRQFNWIRDGRRKNADRKMMKQIRNFTIREQRDVLGYTASLQPPSSKLAAEGWSNPDFERFDRRWKPDSSYRRSLREN